MVQDVNINEQPASLTYRPNGDGAVVQTIRTKINELGRGAITDYNAAVDGIVDWKPAAANAFNYQSGSRVYLHPELGYLGVGSIIIPKGRFDFQSPMEFGLNNLFGVNVSGNGRWSTTLDFHINSGGAVNLRAYVGVHVHDLFLRNNEDAGTSAAINLDGAGGGGNLSIKRVQMEGFQASIRTNGSKNPDGSANPGNGDKTLVEQCSLLTPVGFDQTRNNQAYGWTFLNCEGGSGNTQFAMGGAGLTTIFSQIGNVFGSFIKLPESSGNPGSGRVGAQNNHYYGQNVHVYSSQLEYHGTGDRMLLDARQSVKLTDVGGAVIGGSHAVVVFRDTAIVSGENWPDPTTHTVIQVGQNTSASGPAVWSGSDAIRVRQYGGWIEGVVKIGSPATNSKYAPGQPHPRWMFKDALRAPDPATLQLLGAGNHPILEWQGNEGMPLDQVRGGQAASFAVEAEKALLIPIAGRLLIDTRTLEAGGLGDQINQIPPGSGRYGKDHTIIIPNTLKPATVVGGQTHATVPQLRLGVHILTAPTEDTQITQYADSAFTIPIGPTFQVPVGQPGKGLHIVHMVLNNIQEGKMYVRITKPGLNQVTDGKLVLFYFPYLGI